MGRDPNRAARGVRAARKRNREVDDEGAQVASAPAGHKRPRGRAPTGKEWNAATGKWDYCATETAPPRPRPSVAEEEVQEAEGLQLHLSKRSQTGGQHTFEPPLLARLRHSPALAFAPQATWASITSRPLRKTNIPFERSSIVSS